MTVSLGSDWCTPEQKFYFLLHAWTIQIFHGILHILFLLSSARQGWRKTPRSRWLQTITEEEPGSLNTWRRTRSTFLLPAPIRVEVRMIKSSHLGSFMCSRFYLYLPATWPIQWSSLSLIWWIDSNSCTACFPRVKVLSTVTFLTIWVYCCLFL